MDEAGGMKPQDVMIASPPPSLLTKKMAEGWRAAINGEAVETRSLADQILFCAKERHSSSLVRKVFAEGFRRTHPFYFIFAVTFPGERKRELRRTKAWLEPFSLSFSTSALTARPCRFIFVVKRNTKFAGLTARHGGSGWQLPSKCDSEFRMG